MTAPTLHQRVQAATGADREIDAELWALSEGRAIRHDERTNVIYADKDGDSVPVGHIDPGKFSRNFTARSALAFPAYTASLDATLELCARVLPGWMLTLAQYDGFWQAQFCGRAGKRFREFGSEGKTPALALLSAMLTALEDDVVSRGGVDD